MINGHEQLQDITIRWVTNCSSNSLKPASLPALQASPLYSKNSSPAAGVTKGKNMLAGDMISYTHCSR